MPFKSDMDVASVFIKQSKDPGLKEDGFILITYDLALKSALNIHLSFHYYTILFIIRLLKG